MEWQNGTSYFYHCKQITSTGYTFEDSFGRVFIFFCNESPPAGFYMLVYLIAKNLKIKDLTFHHHTNTDSVTYETENHPIRKTHRITLKLKLWDTRMSAHLFDCDKKVLNTHKWVGTKHNCLVATSQNKQLQVADPDIWNDAVTSRTGGRQQQTAGVLYVKIKAILMGSKQGVRRLLTATCRSCRTASHLENLFDWSGEGLVE